MAIVWPGLPDLAGLTDEEAREVWESVSPEQRRAWWEAAMRPTWFAQFLEKKAEGKP